MAKDPIFPLYYNDIDRSTKDWTDEEFGAYMRLLMHQWDKSGLPLGFDRLSRIAPSVERNWGMLSAKFEEVDGVLKNPILEKIRAERLIFKQRQAENGKKGGRPKKPDTIPVKTQPQTQTEPKKKPLEEEVEIEDENEWREGNYLIPKMVEIFTKHNPSYPAEKNLDGKSIMKIARFLVVQGNLRGSPENNSEAIFEAWDGLSSFIVSDKFYCQKSLSTISNCIQEIVQKALHGDKSKHVKAGTAASQEDVKAALRRRTGQGAPG